MPSLHLSTFLMFFKSCFDVSGKGLLPMEVQSGQSLPVIWMGAEWPRGTSVDTRSFYFVELDKHLLQMYIVASDHASIRLTVHLGTLHFSFNTKWTVVAI